MNEGLCRVAEEIRCKYQAVAHSGLRGGSGAGQMNAVRAEAYREVLTLLLAEILGRRPTREESAAWIAGRAILVPVPVEERPAVAPERVGALLVSAVH